MHPLLHVSLVEQSLGRQAIQHCSAATSWPGQSTCLKDSELPSSSFPRNLPREARASWNMSGTAWAEEREVEVLQPLVPALIVWGLACWAPPALGSFEQALGDKLCLFYFQPPEGDPSSPAPPFS